MHTSGQSYLLKLRAGDAHLQHMENDKSEAYNQLDVSVLHTLILEKELGIGAEKLAAGGHISYTINPCEAMEKVNSGEYSAAFLLRPTPTEQVQAVAAAGDKMPQKSTYFYPKLYTGLVLRPLDHALIWRDGNVLVSRRKADADHLPGLWEFPGGKCNDGETPEQCCIREAREELGVDVGITGERETIEYSYPQRRVTIHPFDCVILNGEPQPHGSDELRWVAPRDFNADEFPAANHGFMKKLQRHSL
jgi:mutator protein MutT